MGTLLGGFGDLLRTYAITGNAMIDTIIIANIIPIFMAYLTNMFDVLKYIIASVVAYFWTLIGDKLKSKIFGNVLCEMDISTASPVFNSLKTAVTKAETHPLECTGQKVTRKILDIINTKMEYRRYNNNYYLHFNRNESNFSLTQSYSSEEEKIKIYCKNNLYIILKYIKRKAEAKYVQGARTEPTEPFERIDLRLVSFEDVQLSKDDVNLYFNDFLINDLKLSNEIIYVTYITSRSKKMSRFLSNFLSGRYASSSLGTLTYGDGDFYDKEENHNESVETSSYVFSLKNDEINSLTENIKSLITFDGEGKSSSDNGGFNVLCKKYLGKTLNSGDGYGYFYDKHILHFITREPDLIVLVSKGKLLTQDIIKERIEYILQESINNNEHNSKKPKTITKTQIKLYSYDGPHQNWRSAYLDVRGFDTIYLPDKLLGEIKREMNNFINSSKLYKLCSIPYKKGILLYGPPGTGKTSFVKALAYEYQMSIYTVNLNDENINDETINNVLSSIASTENKILLFEDIDTAFADKESVKIESKMEEAPKDLGKKDSKNESEKQQKGPVKFLTYSGLLNALDGVLTNHHGVITIMTTNYIERLGQAFIRPGRIDRKFLLKECNREQIVKMCNSIVSRYLITLKEQMEEAKFDENKVIFGDAVNTKYFDDKLLTLKVNQFADNLMEGDEFSRIAPSKLQVYLLRYIENIDEMFSNYGELLV